MDTLAALVERTREGGDVHAPRLLPAEDEATPSELRRLVESGQVVNAYDTVVHQLGELLDTRHPEPKSPERLAHLVVEHLAGRNPSQYGTCAH
jgi:hypothetical protein